MPPKGRPPKKKRNISGLKNQSTSFEISTSQNMDNKPDNNTDGDGGNDQPPKDLKDMAGSEQEDEPDSDFESDHEWEGLTSHSDEILDPARPLTAQKVAKKFWPMENVVGI
jgi:hypothetical protein